MTSVAKLFKTRKTIFGYSLFLMFNLARHYHKSAFLKKFRQESFAHCVIDFEGVFLSKSFVNITV